jgi:hypothetical protein
MVEVMQMLCPCLQRMPPLLARAARRRPAQLEGHEVQMPARTQKGRPKDGLSGPTLQRRSVAAACACPSHTDSLRLLPRSTVCQAHHPPPWSQRGSPSQLGQGVDDGGAEGGVVHQEGEDVAARHPPEGGGGWVGGGGLNVGGWVGGGEGRGLQGERRRSVYGACSMLGPPPCLSSPA